MVTKKRPKPQGEIKPLPLLAENAIDKLNGIVRGARVFEYGSGGSTLWLAQRARQLISIEDDPDWHAAVVAGLSAHQLKSEVKLVDTLSIPKTIHHRGMFDVVFVDCRKQAMRRQAIILGAKHVKSGGWLVVDDYNFPLVKKSVNQLSKDVWEVTILSGKKIHAVRHDKVSAHTAFCQKHIVEGQNGK